MTGNAGRIRKAVILSLISFAVSLALYASGLVGAFELKAYDLFSRWLNPDKASGDIVIVQVDQRSIELLAAEGITWPWPRQMYAPLLEALSEAEAVFIDILFTEPSSYGEEDDRILADAMARAGNVYLPVFLTSGRGGMGERERAFLGRIAVKDGGPQRRSYPSAIIPVDTLLPAARGAGNVMIRPDGDGIYRRVPLLFQVGGMTIPHFVLDYLLQKGRASVRGNEVFLGGRPFPMADDALLLRYSRGDHPFPVFSAAELFKSSSKGAASRGKTVDPGYFRGKKVFIGLTAAGLYDLKPTAVTSISSGVHIHAATLDALLHGNFMRPISLRLTFVLILVLCYVVSRFVLTHNSLSLNLLFFGLAALFTLALTVILFEHAWYFQVVPPFTALVVSYTTASVYSYAVEGRELRFVRRTFAQYMDETLVRHLLANPALIRPGGQRRHVTAFFADIAGFTTLAEQRPAEEAARILHSILNSFTEVIIRNRGVIDKYIGDSVMAFWGAPLATEQDETNACLAALQCLDELATINQRFREEGMPEVAVRVGINAGDAIVGNLGSDRLFDYTVIGDTVNLASRLESANKMFETHIAVSAAVLERTGGVFLTREMGMLGVKGKAQPVMVHELLGRRESAGEEALRLAALHRDGITRFQEKKWDEAVRIFSEILEFNPGDGLAAFYRERCESLLRSGPLTEDWNVIRLTEK